MVKKQILGPILPILPKLGPQNFFVDFISTRCQTLQQTIIVCNFKESISSKLMQMGKNFILGLIQSHWTQIQAANFFKKNLATSVTKYQGKISACKISSLEKICWYINLMFGKIWQIWTILTTFLYVCKTHKS